MNTKLKITTSLTNTAGIKANLYMSDPKTSLEQMPLSTPLKKNDSESIYFTQDSSEQSTEPSS